MRQPDAQQSPIQFSSAQQGVVSDFEARESIRRSLSQSAIAGASLAAAGAAPILPSIYNSAGIAISSFSDIINSPAAALQVAKYSIHDSLGVIRSAGQLAREDAAAYVDVRSHRESITSRLRQLDEEESAFRFVPFSSRLDSFKADIALGALTTANKAGMLVGNALVTTLGEVVGGTMALGLGALPGGLIGALVAPTLTGPTFGAAQRGMENSFSGYMEARQALKGAGEIGTAIPPSEAIKLQWAVNRQSLSPAEWGQPLMYHFMGYRNDEVQTAMRQMAVEGRFEQPTQTYSGAAEKMSKKLMATLKDVDKAARLLDISKKEAWGLVRQNEAAGISTESFTNAVLKTSLMTGENQNVVAQNIMKNSQVLQSLGIAPGMLAINLQQSSTQSAMRIAPMLTQQQLLQAGGRAGIEGTINTYNMQGFAEKEEMIRLALGSGQNLKNVHSWAQMQMAASKGMSTDVGGYYRSVSRGGDRERNMSGEEIARINAQYDLSIIKSQVPNFDKLSEKDKYDTVRGYAIKELGKSDAEARIIADQIANADNQDPSKMSPAERAKWDAKLQSEKDVNSAMAIGQRLRTGFSPGLKWVGREAVKAMTPALAVETIFGPTGIISGLAADIGKGAAENRRISILAKEGKLDLEKEVRDRARVELSTFNIGAKGYSYENARRSLIQNMEMGKEIDAISDTTQGRRALRAITESTSLDSDLKNAAKGNDIKEFMRVLDESGKSELKDSRVRAMLARKYKLDIDYTATFEEREKRATGKLLKLVGLGGETQLGEAEELRRERLGLTREAIQKRTEKEAKAAKERQREATRSAYEKSDKLSEAAIDFVSKGALYSALKETGVLSSVASTFGLKETVAEKNYKLETSAIPFLSGLLRKSNSPAEAPLFSMERYGKENSKQGMEGINTMEQNGVAPETEIIQLLKLANSNLHYIAYQK